MTRTVGCVPYVNAKPLIGMFEAFGEASPVRVVLGVPSSLPALLDSGEAEAALVSSFEALRSPGRTFAEGSSIATFGDAASVRLFSKVPFEDIGTLALDRSSLTSNHLALILLAERYGVRPQAAPALPDLHAMLSIADAAILIGDKGMTADGAGLHVLDLGREWTLHTGLPFVWALWVGREDLSPDLVAQLAESVRWGEQHRDEIVERAARTAGWPLDVCRRYLTEIMDYRLTPAHLDGLRTYAEKLIAHGFIRNETFPRSVAATPAYL